MTKRSSPLPFPFRHQFCNEYLKLSSMKSIIMAALVTLSLTCTAQQKKEHHTYGKKESMRYLPSITHSLGGSLQQFNGLNARVKNLPQYKPLKDYTATLGLGWIKEKDQVISDMGIAIGSSMSRHRNDKSSTIRYIGLHANAGYDILKSKKVTLYPLAGIGFQAYQAVFYKDNSNVDFDDVLSSPVVQNSIDAVKFSNSFWVYRVGAGVSFSSPRQPSASIGLQAGYTGSFRKRAWRSKENQLLRNAPEDRLSQFYVSLVLTSNPWMMHR